MPKAEKVRLNLALWAASCGMNPDDLLNSESVKRELQMFPDGDAAGLLDAVRGSFVLNDEARRLLQDPKEKLMFLMLFA